MGRPPKISVPERITTPRLVIRPPLPGDGPGLRAAIEESLPELRPWMPWAQSVPDLDEAEENVKQAYLEWVARKDLRLSIFSRDGKKFLGSSGLHKIDWKERHFEIGYWVRTSVAGQGIITEAVNAIARMAFGALGAKQIEIRLDPENLKSRAVVERLSFEYCERLPADVVRPKSRDLRDTEIFRIKNINSLPPLEVQW